jgi:uncharacterized protein involved in exopolysaccharide biosynthesis
MELKYYDLIQMLKRRIKLILLIISLFSIVGLISALIIKDAYISSAKLASNSSNGNEGLLSAFSSYASLLPVSGLNLSGAGDQTEHAMEFIQSWTFSNHIVNKYDLFNDLFAIDYWDKQKDLIFYNNNIYNKDTGEWFIKRPDGEIGKPTPLMVHEEFASHVTFLYEPGDGVLSITLEAASPELAKFWLELIIKEINIYFRDKANAESLNNIKTLNKIMNSTNLKSIETAALGLIEKQTETLMFAQAKEEYMFTVLIPPYLPEKKSKPQRALICILFITLGIFLSIFIAIALEINAKKLMV